MPSCSPYFSHIVSPFGFSEEARQEGLKRSQRGMRRLRKGKPCAISCPPQEALAYDNFLRTTVLKGKYPLTDFHVRRVSSHVHCRYPRTVAKEYKQYRCTFVMRISYLCLGLVSLLFYTACGSNSGTVTGFVPKGQFSNASVNGNYVYQIEGFDFSTTTNGVAYREAGVFAANGSGAVTVTDDFSEGSTILNTTSTGSYSISNDGTGSLSFNNALGTIKLAVTLVSSSKVYLVEGDPALNAGGLAEKQDATAISAAPSGTFAFREHDVNPESVAKVGVFGISGGTVGSGSVDVNRSGGFSSLTFTAGSFNTPDSTTGRGTGSLTDSSPATTTFFYYVVDVNNVRFLASTPGIVGLGRAEKQSGTPALSGSYAFGSKGDTSSFLAGVTTAGRFTAMAGSITAGARDSVQDGTTATNVSFTGTYY